jgi:hypothetical protein
MLKVRLPGFSSRRRQFRGPEGMQLIARLLTDQGAKHWRGYAFAIAMTVVVATTTTMTAWIM